ncbi:hypothetical protein ACFVUN_35825 [Kitasatospora griseola]|uniref:hypothetical protein n=1 Tax=Kitasatospora griseola TaxID=2064 RepID=UPI0036DE397C
MSTDDGFLGILSGAQREWFQRQPAPKQAALTAQWQGSGDSPEDIVENNGGPPARGGGNGLPDYQ